ncbi:MAG: tetratricopeptide repeat protein, partial [Bacteroidales bacterium]|nr:tetratricopeptide repeat protein [Bacteroidales bacterium]
FGKDKNGKVNQLVYYQNVSLHKGEPVSAIIEEIIEKSGIKDALTKYYDLKSNPCDEILFYERCINSLGHKYLGEGENNNAIEVFKLNTKEHPDSWNAFDSLGEAYMKNGDNDLAIENYKKSIELNPENTNGEEKLAELTEK